MVLGTYSFFKTSVKSKIFRGVTTHQLKSKKVQENDLTTINKIVFCLVFFNKCFEECFVFYGNSNKCC